MQNAIIIIKSWCYVGMGGCFSSRWWSGWKCISKFLLKMAAILPRLHYVWCLWIDTMPKKNQYHDDVIKWKRFPRRWPFVRGIHRSPVNSPHKGQWRGALRFSSICAWINNWVNNREAGDLRRHRAHNDVIVMGCFFWVHSLDKVLDFFLLYCVQCHVIYDPWYIERQ